jgi:hypothetical protein
LSFSESSTDTNFLINGIDVKNTYLTNNNLFSITGTGDGADGNAKYDVIISNNLSATTQTTVSLVGMNGSVESIARDSNNNVYVGGLFTTAGGVTVNYIAKWI